ncbi:dipeptidase [Kordiimonas aestuarii]|uniref:dipeptidase n=1 Tax=Kordiimonas aestuarii TaxID=1005925 RepID=UPI0021D1B7CC|nr:dipeptidase [Kordiimonas aestuarii]
MKSRLIKILGGIALLAVILLIVAFTAGPGMLERSLNRVIDHRPHQISAEAQEFHDSLLVADWHADTMLWKRNLLERAKRGHVDLPRLRDGGIGLQMFTTVTKTPRDMNVHENDSASDNITAVSYLQLWPGATHNSLLARALYQAEKLDGFIKKSAGGLMWVRSKTELAAFLAAREGSAATAPIGAMLGSEGGHPLEGRIENLDKMYAAGFRMIGLTHFFDNELGGSLHGTSKAGLTEFGRSVVTRMDDLGMIIDLAHSSVQTARDTLALTKRPVVVSHTGFRGACDSERNFPDRLMKAIAAKGGVIAVGLWHQAICGTTPEAVANSLAYGIALVGADHVALGSDWDGAVAAMPSDHTPAITAALLKRGISEDDIRKVMGGSSIAFLQKWLPD